MSVALSLHVARKVFVRICSILQCWILIRLKTITGKMYEILYEVADGQLVETERLYLCPAEGKYGCQVPKGVWHTVEVIEPSVIYEAKDGKYGEDGSETY